MTLTGTGDLVLHEGALFVHSSSTESSDDAWMKQSPPEALVVSGGSLGVRGGRVEVFSNYADVSALAVSVGGWVNESDFDGHGALPRTPEGSLSYTGSALAVNVKQPSSDRFRLLELSTGRNEGSEDASGDNVKSVFSVRGDGRVSMAGGGGIVLEEGDLELLRGDAAFKVIFPRPSSYVSTHFFECLWVITIIGTEMISRQNPIPLEYSSCLGLREFADGEFVNTSMTAAINVCPKTISYTTCFRQMF